jgi:transposase
LLLDAGKSSESIAEYLFLSGNTVTNYLKKYQTGGLEDLVSDDYQGSECRLSKVQQRKLAQHLEETLYQTVSLIREHIQVTYNVTYSLSGLRHLLRRLDFVFKKPKAIPGKADKVAQEEFLRLIEAKLAEIVSCGGREKRPFIMLMALAQQFSFIFSKMNEAGFIKILCAFNQLHHFGPP